jgi:small subunit ribosomal protein S6
MPEPRVYLYEGLFLFNNSAINSSVASATQILKDILARAEAEVVSIARWDDRKLAFTVDGQKRGLYLLTYFRARGSQIPNIERDVNLSDEVLRCLILRAEHVGQAELDVSIQNQQTTQDHIKLEGERAAAPAPATAPAAVTTTAPAAQPAGSDHA